MLVADHPHINGSKRSQQASGNPVRWMRILMRTLFHCLLVSGLFLVPISYAGSSRSHLAVTAMPSSDRDGISGLASSTEEGIRLAPDDLNARGQELENTFYEIEGPAPFHKSGSMPVQPDDEPNKESDARTPVLGNRMTIWAVGAAGIVGLGTLGYLTLVDNSPKPPQKIVTVFTEK